MTCWRPFIRHVSSGFRSSIFHLGEPGFDHRRGGMYMYPGQSMPRRAMFLRVSFVAGGRREKDRLESKMDGWMMEGRRREAPGPPRKT